MEYRKIQVANCEDIVKRIINARKHDDLIEIAQAKEFLKETLEAIKNVDPETYQRYLPYLSD